ncbi:MAG: CobW family GTP-binding protein [Alphaproteobacteria bacterium]
MFRAPVDVVTGWLGSGKTTLVRRLLESPAGARVAVVVNELAGLDVDGRTLDGLDGVGRAVELAGGCLCCEVEESRLARALSALVDRVQPDLVVVETSGAADPGPTVSRLRDAGLTLDAVVALVDAEHGDRDLARPVGHAQVAAADFVLVNRVDLASIATVEALERHVVRINPRALLRRCVRADVDPALVFATGAGVLVRGDVRTAEATGRPAVTHDVEARAHRTPARLDPDRLHRVLATLPDAVHRAKGIARVPGSDLGLLFNAVRRRVEFEWLPRATSESRAVVVGEGLAREWPRIRAALEACESTTAPGQESSRPAAGGAGDSTAAAHGDSTSREGGESCPEPAGPALGGVRAGSAR